MSDIKLLWHLLRSGNKAIWFTILFGSITTLLVGLFGLEYFFWPVPSLPQTQTWLGSMADPNNPLYYPQLKLLLYHLFSFIAVLMIWGGIVRRMPIVRMVKYLFPGDYAKGEAYLEDVERQES